MKKSSNPDDNVIASAVLDSGGLDKNVAYFHVS